MERVSHHRQCLKCEFRIFIKQDAWQRIARHAENASKNVCFSQNHPQKRPRVCGAGGECRAMKQKRRGDRGYPNHTAPSLHPAATPHGLARRSEEPTSELPSLMRNSYAVFCLKKKT